MRIKRFEAENSSTALAMIKEEMGDDAVILASKEIKAGGGKGRRVEVVAAVDYDSDSLEAALPEKESPPQGYGYRTIRRDKGEVSKNPAPEPPALRKSVGEIHSEAHDLRLRFANIFRTPKEREGGRHETKRPKVFGGIPEKSESAKGKKANPEDVARWRRQLIDKLRFSEGASGEPTREGDIIALVGSTGVGKTTTAAKLAAWYSLQRGMRVCLLSMDCYRIGATDQLRTYGRIMRLPCEVVLRRADLLKAVRRHADKLIIIDTAGKSPYDTKHIAELQEWFSPIEDIDIHLVLNATTKKEDLSHIIEVYRPLGIDSMVLTKLDETRAYAALCHQVVASRLPISYLGIGQRVPEDFKIAEKGYLDSLFRGGEEAGSLL